MIWASATSAVYWHYCTQWSSGSARQKWTNQTANHRVQRPVVRACAVSFKIVVMILHQTISETLRGDTQGEPRH